MEGSINPPPTTGGKGKGKAKTGEGKRDAKKKPTRKGQRGGDNMHVDLAHKVAKDLVKYRVQKLEFPNEDSSDYDQNVFPCMTLGWAWKKINDFQDKKTGDDGYVNFSGEKSLLINGVSIDEFDVNHPISRDEVVDLIQQMAFKVWEVQNGKGSDWKNDGHELKEFARETLKIILGKTNNCINDNVEHKIKKAAVEKEAKRLAKKLADEAEAKRLESLKDINGKIDDIIVSNNQSIYQFIKNTDNLFTDSDKTTNTIINNIDEKHKIRPPTTSEYDILDKYNNELIQANAELLNEITRLEETIQIYININKMIIRIHSSIGLFNEQEKDDKKTTIGIFIELEKNKPVISSEKTILEAYYMKLVNSNEDLNSAVRVYVRVGGKENVGETVDISFGGKSNDRVSSITFDGQNYEGFYDCFGLNAITSGDCNDNDKGCRSIFNESLLNLCNQVMSGYNVVVFGYGYSGSGKSYTLLENSDSLLQSSLNYFIQQGKHVKISKCYEAYFESYNFRGNNTNTPTMSGQIILHDIPAETLKMSIDALTKYVKGIDSIRTTEKRIKVTMNNPNSSRSHLFIELEVDKGGKIIFCDMGGRENPLDMYKKTKIDKKTGFIQCGNEWYDLNGQKQNPNQPDKITVENIIKKAYSTYDTILLTKSLQAHNNDKIYMNQIFIETSFNERNPQKMSEEPDHIKKAVMHVLKTCEEGLYINETINHMTYYFQKVINPTFNSVFDQLKLTRVVNVNNNGQVIQETRPATEYNPNTVVFVQPTLNDRKEFDIIKILKGYASNEKPTKYVMYACIRPDKQDDIISFSKSTLKFGQDVSSASVTKTVAKTGGKLSLKKTIKKAPKKKIPKKKK